MTNSPCWCQSGKTAEQCCAPFLEGREHAPTCEALMRSRYSAFVTENKDYLLKTWAQAQRPQTLDFDENCKWLGLKIRSSSKGQVPDTEGQVHFLARYKVAGKAQRIDERSHFIREHGRWVYSHALEFND